MVFSPLDQSRVDRPRACQVNLRQHLNSVKKRIQVWILNQNPISKTGLPMKKKGLVQNITEVPIG
jgi:hypothetical protein